MADTKLLWLGDSVPCQRYSELYSRHPKVLNFKNKELVISLCAKSLCPGPYRIGLDVDDVESITNIELSSNCLVINDSYRLEVNPKNIWSCPIGEKLGFTNPVKEIIWQNWIAFVTRLSPNCVMQQALQHRGVKPGFQGCVAESYRRGIDYLMVENWMDAVPCFKRIGQGLTPAGDDFLVGLLLGLAWLHRMQKKELSKIAELIYRASLGSDALVNTFMLQTITLNLDYDWSMFLQMLNSGAYPESLLWQDKVKSEGSSSGADKLSGFYTAMAICIDKIRIDILRKLL
ncbi:MAG: DUF2877 domain-containing protein [Candidatus Cloacimonetes bacterium]|nr:DUF2877 domain-containing protein [Candidatus Cloacimonadota bacterium]